MERYSDISQVYDEKFFKNMVHYEQRSAPAFASIILKALRPKSIIDVGCGNGIYLKAFKDLGVNDLVGYDGSEHAVAMALLPGKVKLYDLRNPLVISRQYDLCLCMEVAEHLPPEYAEVLVNSLIGLSSIVVFSAAKPGQGGKEHINEQPHEYWINLFQRRKYRCKRALVERLRKEMREKHVIWWIVQNILVFEQA